MLCDSAGHSNYWQSCTNDQIRETTFCSVQMCSCRVLACIYRCQTCKQLCLSAQAGLLQCSAMITGINQIKLLKKQHNATMQNAPAANASNLSVSAANPLKLSRFLTISVSAFSTLRNAKPTCGYTTANSALLTQHLNVENPSASSLGATAFIGAWYVSAASFCHCHSTKDSVRCTRSTSALVFTLAVICHLNEACFTCEMMPNSISPRKYIGAVMKAGARMVA